MYIISTNSKETLYIPRIRCTSLKHRGYITPNKKSSIDFLPFTGLGSNTMEDPIDFSCPSLAQCFIHTLNYLEKLNPYDHNVRILNITKHIKADPYLGLEGEAQFTTTILNGLTLNNEKYHSTHYFDELMTIKNSYFQIYFDKK